MRSLGFICAVMAALTPMGRVDRRATAAMIRAGQSRPWAGANMLIDAGPRDLCAVRALPDYGLI